MADAAAPPRPVDRDRCAFGDTRDAAADFGHHAPHLVAERHGQGIGETLFGQIEHEVVRMARSGGRHLQQHLARTRHRLVHFPQLRGLTWFDDLNGFMRIPFDPGESDPTSGLLGRAQRHVSSGELDMNFSTWRRGVHHRRVHHRRDGFRAAQRTHCRAAEEPRAARGRSPCRRSHSVRTIRDRRVRAQRRSRPDEPVTARAGPPAGLARRRASSLRDRARRRRQRPLSPR